MIRLLALGFAGFLAGAVATTAIRAAAHRPGDAAPAPAPVAHARPVPAATGTATAAAMPPASAATVNTRCPICGMAVDPRIPPATYQGRLVGFGCAMCPPKFAADPARYGEAALHDLVVED